MFLLGFVKSWLLWRYANWSNLLYSGFRYTIELPFQPYKMQLYTFRVQGLAFFFYLGSSTYTYGIVCTAHISENSQIIQIIINVRNSDFW